ncbi:hypothetical protein ACE193_21215 [Bernardetia sp. OM2101]|uniref:hypothetical protein n=1 Tax=Bernardetia sp. OM2101 TaxID=3344876 RepID=UPI0035D0D2AD
MRFSDKEILKIDTTYLAPTLRVHLELMHSVAYAPISFTSQLKLNGKIISQYNSIPNVNHFSTMQLSAKSNIDLIQKSNFYIDFYYPLDKRAIQAIENHRLQTQDKSVQLEIKMLINYLSVYNTINVNALSLEKRLNPIEQSTWVREFAPKLGIGEFILLEHRTPNQAVFEKKLEDMPEDSKLRKFLSDGLSQSYKNLEKAKQKLAMGDWEGSILASRVLIESFMTGSDSDERTNELKDLYIRSHETDTGFNEFRNIIRNAFDYSSKYIHIVGQGQNRANIQLMPVAREEDAYFVYSLCVSFLYMIKNKVSR